MEHEQLIASLGEFGLIDRIAGIVGSGRAILGIGDDTAVIEQSGDDYLLATVDMLVEDVHFRRKTTSAFELGSRALAVNLSDIAAMGGTPHSALSSLALPPDLAVSWVENLYQGMAHLARRYEMDIVGGNISRTHGPITIDITVLGSVRKEHLVTRQGARPGDVLLVGGFLGDRAAALELSNHPHEAQKVLYQDFLRSQVVPAPQVELGAALGSRRIPHAMMDISDGLASDVHHLARAGGVGAVIYEEQLPISGTTRRIAQSIEKDPRHWALSGGEDYVLLIAIPEERLSDARAAAGNTPLYQIGTVLSADQGVLLEHFGGSRVPLRASGWTHF